MWQQDLFARCGVPSLTRILVRQTVEAQLRLGAAFLSLFCGAPILLVACSAKKARQHARTRPLMFACLTEPRPVSHAMITDDLRSLIPVIAA